MMLAKGDAEKSSMHEVRRAGEQMPRAFVDPMRCAATEAGLMRVTAFRLARLPASNDGRCTNATINRRSPGLAQSRI